jgi:hypothetical protein
MAKNTPSCATTPEQRAAIGRLIRDLIDAGRQTKGHVEYWWLNCEQYHRNEFRESDSPGTGWVPVPIPYSQPRQDMLTAQVCGVIARQAPYMLAETANGDSVVEDAKQKVNQKFWKQSKFEIQIRKASNICTDTNLVWYRLAWDKTSRKPFTGLLMDVFHPKHCVLFPATVRGIEGARLVAHTFPLRQREIEDLQKVGPAKGGYFKDGPPVTGGDTASAQDTTGEIINSGAQPDVSGPDPKDARVDCWSGCLKYGEDGQPEKWYSVTIAYDNATLLQFEDYPYSRPWYFDARYVTETNDAYWPGVSVARHLSVLQDASNKLSSGLYNGAMASAFPNTYGPDLPEKDSRQMWGDVVQSDMPQQIFTPNSRFNGAPFDGQLNRLDLIGDKAARVSANTMGAVQDRSTTATENSIIASGVATGIEEYIANFCEPLPAMAEFTEELLSLHFKDWAQDAMALGVQQAVLEAPCTWDVSGASPGNTPGAKLAATEKLGQFAKQFGPQSGIKPHALAKVAVANSGLAGADDILMTDEEMAQQQAQSAQQQQAQADQQALLKNPATASTLLGQAEPQGPPQGGILGQLLQELSGIMQPPAVPAGPPQGPGPQPGSSPGQMSPDVQHLLLNVLARSQGQQGQ